MSIATFTRNLKKVLYQRLPQSNEYVWSNRVEGALVRSEESAAHDTGAVIIDDKLLGEQSKEISELLIDFLSHDAYFKKTKYKAMVWIESTFTAIHEHGGVALCSIKGLETDLKCITTSGTTSGGWENFKELYSPLKKAGQVFLITTQEKVDLLEQAQTMAIKNLVIIYPHTDEKKRNASVKNIPCVPFEQCASMENDHEGQ